MTNRGEKPMIISVVKKMVGLRASAVTLSALVALLLASAPAAAKVGPEAGALDSAGKRIGIDDMIRARPGGHHKHHKKGARHHRKRHSHGGAKKGGSRSQSKNGPGGGNGSPSKAPSSTGSPTPEATPSTPAAPVVQPPSSGTPAAPPPTPPPAACTTFASSVRAAESAVSSGAPGTVVCLADGTYGTVNLTGSKASPGVTLRATDPGGATIAGATISGSGLTLAYFDTTDEIEVEPGSSLITIQDNKLAGGYFGVDACNSTSTTCNDVKIVGNKFEGPYGEDGIRANRYHDANGDGIGLLVEGNEFTGIRENGNHSDCLQSVWTGDNLVFRRNYVHDNRCQGFFVKDQNSLCGSGSSGVCGPVQGIRVEDNLFLRNEEPCASSAPGCGQPIIVQIFGPYSGAVISHNTVWGDGETSLLALREGVAAGTRVEENAIYRFWTDTNASAASFQNNTYCMLEGSWPSSRPGSSIECAPGFANTAIDDYRLASGRGVDWAPSEARFGP